MRLKKASHHAGQSVKKKNMRRSTFVTVISLLFFTSLCVLSLLGRQPSALAVGAHPSILHDSGSSSSGPSIDCTNLANAESDQCFGGGGLISGTPTGNPVSVNSDDRHKYLDGDPTCDPVNNPKVADGITTFYERNPTAYFGVSRNPASEPINENTCGSDSKCYSDNSSGHDGQTIADHIGGDDVTCYNSVCFLSSDTWPANTCGTGLPYDRFTCADTGISITINGIDSHSRTHHNGDYPSYFNPTAYDPPAILEIPTVHGETGRFDTADNLHVKLDRRHDPSCDGGSWSCPGDDPVIITLANVSFKGYANLQGIQPVFWVMCGASGATRKALGGSSVGACSYNSEVLQADWLSGDRGKGAGSGHLVFTSLDDTINQKYVKILFGDTLAIAYALITPVCVLIGYQLFVASWTGRSASLQDTVPRVLLSVVAIAISYQLVTMLIVIFDIFDVAIVNVHVALPYPPGVVAGGVFTYTAAADNDPLSYRGIVIPVNQWGCTIDDFVGILTKKLISDAMAFIPFVGGMLQFALGIADAIDLFLHLAEFLRFLLSLNLCVQLFIRIILINYYILMAPVAFGCWGLPAGAGEKVVGQWMKGFLSILFVQTVQLFVLTTLPLIAPEYPSMPATHFHIINEVFRELPSVIVLAVVVQIPKMMGGGATRAMAQAGTVASGAVAAVGAAAYQMV